MTQITDFMDGVVVVDRGGVIALLSPAAEELLGAKALCAVGRPLAALPGRDDLRRAILADHGRVRAQQPISQVVEVHVDAHELQYVRSETRVLHDHEGTPAGAITVLRDVTATHKSDQLRNQYLSIVAHELRTPLTGIKTFATMLAKGRLGPLGERQQTVCDSIREQAIRLEHQIDKLIHLGNLESDELGQDREICTVAAFAAGLLEPFEQPARTRRIDLTITVEGGDEELCLDRTSLRRACQALIENAVKFVRDGGRVAVAIERSPAGLRFRVTDDGIGVDPRYHGRIFEKFFQVEDPLTRHHGGAGLGLFVAQGIVAAHGSRIEVSSQLGQGADFSFVLPVRRRDEAAAAGSAATEHRA